MAHDYVKFVSRVQALLAVDLKAALDDETFQGALRQFVDPDAEVRFVDPERGALGDRRVPEHGVEGLREGWREWLQPWEHFWIRFDQVLDAGEGRVLSLGELCGQMDVGTEVTQLGAALIQVRNEKIVAANFYVDQDQARRDAGLT